MLIRSLFVMLAAIAGSTAMSSAQAQPYGGGYGDSIECRSSGYNYQRCDVPWGDARIVRQLSDSQCIRGRTWGYDRRGFIWVDRGCAARFVAGGGGGGYGPGPGGPGPGPGGPWQPGPGWNNQFITTCGSPQFRYAFCAVDVGGGGRVSIRRQTSDARCIEGQTWGWNRAGIWVDRGCSADFLVDRRW
jgi:hypothetical protein